MMVSPVSPSAFLVNVFHSAAADEAKTVLSGRFVFMSKNCASVSVWSSWYTSVLVGFLIYSNTVFFTVCQTRGRQKGRPALRFMEEAAVVEVGRLDHSEEKKFTGGLI